MAAGQRLRPMMLAILADEVERAAAKHGAEAMVSPSLPDAKRLAILGEEYGEVCRALTYDGDEGPEHLAEELVQTAAMALAWAQVVYDRVHNPATVSSGPEQ